MGLPASTAEFMSASAAVEAEGSSSMRGVCRQYAGLSPW